MWQELPYCRIADVAKMHYAKVAPLSAICKKLRIIQTVNWLSINMLKMLDKSNISVKCHINCMNLSLRINIVLYYIGLPTVQHPIVSLDIHLALHGLFYHAILSGCLITCMIFHVKVVVWIINQECNTHIMYAHMH